MDADLTAHHETSLEEIRRDTHKDLNLPEHVKVQRRHPVIVGYSREEIHQNQLAVAFASIARLLFGLGFPLGSAFNDN